jgi:hypothetical protein
MIFRGRNLFQRNGKINSPFSTPNVGAADQDGSEAASSIWNIRCIVARESLNWRSRLNSP